jgi:hypothetical protein
MKPVPACLHVMQLPSPSDLQTPLATQRIRPPLCRGPILLHPTPSDAPKFRIPTTRLIYLRSDALSASELPCHSVSSRIPRASPPPYVSIPDASQSWGGHRPSPQSQLNHHRAPGILTADHTGFRTRHSGGKAGGRPTCSQSAVFSLQTLGAT